MRQITKNKNINLPLNKQVRRFEIFLKLFHDGGPYHIETVMQELKSKLLIFLLSFSYPDNNPYLFIYRIFLLLLIGEKMK